MARFAVETLGKTRIAFLYVNNDWGIAMRDHFVAEIYLPGSRNYRPGGVFRRNHGFYCDSDKFQALNPDLLYLASMYNDGALINKQRQKLGWHGCDGDGRRIVVLSEIPRTWRGCGGRSADQLRLFPGEPRPEVQKFVKGFEERHQQTPNVFAAVAYDSVNLLAYAIQQAGTDRQAIRDALTQIRDFPGVTGKITFTDVGDVVKEYRKMYVRDGKFQLYAPHE